MSVYLYAVPLLKARETNESNINEAGEGGWNMKMNDYNGMGQEL